MEYGKGMISMWAVHYGRLTERLSKMSRNCVFFRTDQMEQMAAFVSALRFQGQDFLSEVDHHGFYITII